MGRLDRDTWWNLGLGALAALDLALLRASDVLITLRITPDLSGERNALYAAGVAGWDGLLAANVVVLALFVPLLFLYLLERRRYQPLEAGLPFGRFCSQHYFGRDRPFVDVFWRFPRDARYFAMLLGFVGTVSVALATFAIDLSHLAGLHVESYRPIHNAWVELYWVVLWPMASVGYVAFFVLEYALYRMRPASRPAVAAAA